MDKICDVLGIYREWLLDGAFHTFHQAARYVSAGAFLQALGGLKVREASGDFYDQMILVLSTDDCASLAVFGRTYRRPYRLDKLLYGTLNDWDMVLVCAVTAIGGPVSKLVRNASDRHGVIFESSDFRKLIDGHVHPGLAIEPSVEFQNWNEDIWDLDRTNGTYSGGYREARSTFESELKRSSIRSNADLAKHVEDRLRQYGIAPFPLS